MMALPAFGAIAARLLPLLMKPLVWLFAIGGALYYYSNALALRPLGNISMDFSNEICLFCPYIRELVEAVAGAAGATYGAFVRHIWILLILGFGIFMVLSAWKLLKESADKTAELGTDEIKFEIRPWIDGLWKQAVRIAVVGVFLGAVGTLGDAAPRLVSDLTIRPILSMGAYISVKVAQLPENSCPNDVIPGEDRGPHQITSGAMRPLMCMSGILNTITLMGVAKGFETMDKGGAENNTLLWFLGLATAAVFALYGIRIFFELMNIVFTILFFIMFLPVVIASFAFHETWGIAKNVVDNMLNNVAALAVGMIQIALKLSIFYAIMTFAMDKSEGDPFGMMSTLLFVFVFYYYVVEKKLAERFANIKTDAFMNFGDRAYEILKGGVDWAGGSLAKLTKFGLGGKGVKP
ncbi:MAG: hypothetical protein LBG89_00370 [Rickettsiales bacterium]|jgi:large-conductance mechanosensitive channel|nr:hypothetical protein [Rickettsiales bacterium]